MTAARVARFGYLLDTNAISEWTEPQPDPGLMQWLHNVDEQQLYLSVITLGEIRRGIEQLPHGQRRTRLTAWLSDQVVDRFQDRLLPIDVGVAQAWGRICARVDTAGHSVDPLDGLIAATAEAHGLAVVTRNRMDFRGTGVSVICPWDR